MKKPFFNFSIINKALEAILLSTKPSDYDIAADYCQALTEDENIKDLSIYKMYFLNITIIGDTVSSFVSYMDYELRSIDSQFEYKSKNQRGLSETDISIGELFDKLKQTKGEDFRAKYNQLWTYISMFINCYNNLKDRQDNGFREEMFLVNNKYIVNRLTSAILVISKT